MDFVALRAAVALGRLAFIPEIELMLTAQEDGIDGSLWMDVSVGRVIELRRTTAVVDIATTRWRSGTHTLRRDRLYDLQMLDELSNGLRFISYSRGPYDTVNIGLFRERRGAQICVVEPDVSGLHVMWYSSREVRTVSGYAARIARVLDTTSSEDGARARKRAATRHARRVTAALRRQGHDVSDSDIAAYFGA